MKKKMVLPRIADVKIAGGFWGFYRDVVRDSVIPYQWKALNDEIPGAAPSHCVANFRLAAQLNKTGKIDQSFTGNVFQDSDLAKWLEAVAYQLGIEPDPALEQLADETIDLIAAAQESDGYLDTYYTVSQPDQKWTNLRDNHELYCAGHLIEAAVAYYETTGKRKLLDVMEKNVACIASVLGREPGQKRGYPGHPEIELALVRLFHATGKQQYLDLAAYFITERGQSPLYFELEARLRPQDRAWAAEVIRPMLAYYQADKPVVDQDQIRGHSVRSLYLLAGIIDVAFETSDDRLLAAARQLWTSCVERQMYVTGGVGSTHHGESFTFDYHLPNETVYAETCASIALIFAARRFLQIDPQGSFADIIERALYNTCIGGMQLDGTRFLYVNPLTVWPEASEKDPDHWHVTPERQAWFGCACCPPNLARLITSLGQYAYGVLDDTVYVHLYMAGEARLAIHDQRVKFTVQTDYPVRGQIHLEKSGPACVLALRIPGWCKTYHLTVDGQNQSAEIKNGYAPIQCPEGDQKIELNLDMPVTRVYSHPSVPENIGRVALQRGPLVYCLEEADNGGQLWQMRLPVGAEIHEQDEAGLLGGIISLTAEAVRLTVPSDAGLYLNGQPPAAVPVKLKWIPYYAWSNRSPGEMMVWLSETN